MRSTDCASAFLQYAQAVVRRFAGLFLLFVMALPLWLAPASAAASNPSASRQPHTAPRASANETAKYSHGLLWKIEAPGIKSSYLFGTIHSDDTRVTALPPPVISALDASRRLVLEALIDAEGIERMAEAMYFNDDRTLEEIIGKKLFADSLKALNALGLPTQGIEKQKPWAVMVMLSMPVPKSGLYVDLVLEKRAVQLEKPIAGLETMDEQIAVFDEIPLADQIALLAEVVRTRQYLEIDLEEMIKAYLARDLTKLGEIIDKRAPKNARLHKDVMDRLLNRRNIRMAERLAPTLKEGNTFIAVGAAHLPGRTGLLNLIEQAGYRVTSVY